MVMLDTALLRHVLPRNAESDNPRPRRHWLPATYRAGVLVEPVVVLAGIDFSVEGKIRNVVVCYVVQQLPRLLLVGEGRVEVVMADDSTTHVRIQLLADLHLVVHRRLLGQRYPLVRIKRRSIFLVREQNLVLLEEHRSGTLARNLLDVVQESILVGIFLLDLRNRVENALGELDSPVGVVRALELILLDISHLPDCLEKRIHANRAVLLADINDAKRVVRQKTLLDVPRDDGANHLQHLATEGDTLLQYCDVVILILALVGDSGEVD